MNASIAAIKKAYHRLLLKLHPDRLANAPIEEQNAGVESVKDVIMAYKVLSDPVARRTYDLSRSRHESMQPGASQKTPSARPRQSRSTYRSKRPEQTPRPPYQPEPRPTPRSTSRPTGRPADFKPYGAHAQSDGGFDKFDCFQRGKVPEVDLQQFPRPGTTQYARSGSRPQQASTEPRTSKAAQPETPKQTSQQRSPSAVSERKQANSAVPKPNAPVEKTQAQVRWVPSQPASEPETSKSSAPQPIEHAPKNDAKKQKAAHPPRDRASPYLFQPDLLKFSSEPPEKLKPETSDSRASLEKRKHGDGDEEMAESDDRSVPYSGPAHEGLWASLYPNTTPPPKKRCKLAYHNMGIPEPTHEPEQSEDTAMEDKTPLDRTGRFYSNNQFNWQFEITMSPKWEFIGKPYNVTEDSMQYMEPSSCSISLSFLLEEKTTYTPEDDLDRDLAFTLTKAPGGRGLSAINTFLHYGIPKHWDAKAEGVDRPLRVLVLSFSTDGKREKLIKPASGSMQLRTSATIPPLARHCATHTVYSRTEPDRHVRESTIFKTAFPPSRPEQRISELPEMGWRSLSRIDYADLRKTEEHYIAGIHDGAMWYRSVACGWKTA